MRTLLCAIMLLSLSPLSATAQDDDTVRDVSAAEIRVTQGAQPETAKTEDEGPSCREAVLIEDDDPIIVIVEQPCED